MNFIWKIFHDKIDEAVHRQFIRFGRGEYQKRALLSLWKTGSKVKFKSSFEFANDITFFVSRLGNFSFYGKILSKKPIDELQGKKKAGKWVYDVKNITSSQIEELAKEVYYFLLNADSMGIKLRIKPSLPKPGKEEDKVDDKFCQLEIDEKFYRELKEDFFWDIPECKKAMIEHKFIIKEIILPKTEERDFAKLREMAKRKGKIVRIINIDDKNIVSEKNFEA